MPSSECKSKYNSREHDSTEDIIMKKNRSAKQLFIPRAHLYHLKLELGLYRDQVRDRMVVGITTA